MIKTKQVSCNNCNSDKFSILGSGVDFEYQTSSQTFSFVKCKDCNLVYLNPRPRNSELSKIYPQNYLAYNLSEDDKTKKSSLAYKLRSSFYTSKVKYALKFLLSTDNNQISLLDIGAGDGRLLNWYKTIPGKKISTHAVEMNSQAIELLKQQGHNTYHGLYSETNIPHESFDIVHSSHVIEHVSDPHEFTEKSFQLLKPGGLYLTETPNIDCFDAKFFVKRYWGGYHFPRHWTLYTPETFSTSLNEVGFEIIKVRFFPNPVFWVWTLHHFFSEKGFPSFITNRFPVIDVFNNSFSNVIRLGLLSIIDRMLSFAKKGRMGTMQIIARKPIASN